MIGPSTLKKIKRASPKGQPRCAVGRDLEISNSNFQKEKGYYSCTEDPLLFRNLSTYSNKKKKRRGGKNRRISRRVVRGILQCDLFRFVILAKNAVPHRRTCNGVTASQVKGERAIIGFLLHCIGSTRGGASVLYFSRKAQREGRAKKKKNRAASSR